MVAGGAGTHPSSGAGFIGNGLASEHARQFFLPLLAVQPVHLYLRRLLVPRALLPGGNVEDQLTLPEPVEHHGDGVELHPTGVSYADADRMFGLSVTADQQLVSVTAALGEVTDVVDCDSQWNSSRLIG